MLRVLLACALAGGACAATADEGTGFWLGGDIGISSLHRSFSVTGSTRDTEFAMALRGGYAWHPRLLLGVELGGWMLEASDYNDDPTQGVGIRTLYAIAQYHFGPEARLFAKAGLGSVKYWNNHPDENGASGIGGVLGAGYEVWRSGAWSVSPVIDYSWGELDGVTSPPGVSQDLRYRAWALRLAVTWR